MSAPPRPALRPWAGRAARLLRDCAAAAFDPRCAAGDHDLGCLAGPACEDCRIRLRAEGRPDRCGECSAAIAGRQEGARDARCGTCLGSPRRLRVHAPRGHHGVARGLVLAMKGARRDDVAGLLAEATFEDARAREAIRRADAIVPVPAHPVRRRERGFDPAERLAEELARLAGRELGRRVRLRRPLRRSAGEGKQSARSAGERRRALRGTLRARWHARLLVAGKRIVLVDDVVTTGATIAESARLLLRAGARDVIVVACTRAEGVLLDLPAPRRRVP